MSRNVRFLKNTPSTSCSTRYNHGVTLPLRFCHRLDCWNVSEAVDVPGLRTQPMMGPADDPNACKAKEVHGQHGLRAGETHNGSNVPESFNAPLILFYSTLLTVTPEQILNIEQLAVDGQSLQDFVAMRCIYGWQSGCHSGMCIHRNRWQQPRGLKLRVFIGVARKH